MKFFIDYMVEDLFEDNFLTQIENISFKECLQYTSYGFFIGAVISLFQGDISNTIVSLLFAIFLKL